MATTLVNDLRTGPDDLVALLLACHDRIRTFAALGVAVAEGCHAEALVRDACARAARYFREAYPLHVADEELSILPRLRDHDPHLDAALTQMADEHARHTPLVAALIAACERLLAQPAEAWDLAAFGPLSEQLVAELGEHLALEEARVFPAVAALPAPVQAEVVAELRARRTGAAR